MSDIQRLIAWHQAMADEPKRNQAKRAKHLETVSALSQAEANRVDAERIDWAQESLCHVYQNIAEHFQISYLDENGVEATTLPKESLRAAIDAARLTNAVKTKG